MMRFHIGDKFQTTKHLITMEQGGFETQSSPRLGRTCQSIGGLGNLAQKASTWAPGAQLTLNLGCSSSN